MKYRLMLMGLLIGLTTATQVYALSTPLQVTTDLTSLQTAEGSEVVARLEFVLDDFTEANFDIHIDGIIFTSASGNDLIFDFEDGTPQGFSGDPFPADIVPTTLADGQYMLEFSDDSNITGYITTMVLNEITLPHDVIALSFLFDIEQFGDVLYDAVMFQVFLLDSESSSTDWFPAPLLANTPVIYSYNVFEDNYTYNPDFTGVTGIVAIPEPMSIISLVMGVVALVRNRIKKAA